MATNKNLIIRMVLKLEKLYHQPIPSKSKNTTIYSLSQMQTLAGKLVVKTPRTLTISRTNSTTQLMEPSKKAMIKQFKTIWKLSRLNWTIYRDIIISWILISESKQKTGRHHLKSTMWILILSRFKSMYLHLVHYETFD
jgi:ATP-dependent protease Clp ATPase subunit